MGQGHKIRAYARTLFILPLAPPRRTYRMARQSQRLRWTFTINNYLNDDGTEEGMNPELCSYLIEAHEVAESGTVHKQGFCHLIAAMTERQMHEIMPTAALFVTKSTDYQNYLYCAKGEQTKQEWEAFRETGPNWGLNAQFLEWGTRPTAPLNAHKKKPADSTYAEALAAPTVAEGMEIVKKRKARDFCLHGETIEGNLKRHKKGPPKTQSRFLETDFTVPLRGDLSKATLFCGPTNIGKTQYALAHFKNPLLVSHIDELRTLHPDHDGVVFDDISFKNRPPHSIIHLLDMDVDRAIHCRYGNATIPANFRRIFTFNTENPFYNDDVEQEVKNAIERRLQRVRFHNDLRRLRHGQPMDDQVQLDPVDDYTNEMNQVD